MGGEDEKTLSNYVSDGEVMMGQLFCTFIAWVISVITLVALVRAAYKQRSVGDHELLHSIDDLDEDEDEDFDFQERISNATTEGIRAVSNMGSAMIEVLNTLILFHHNDLS